MNVRFKIFPIFVTTLCALALPGIVAAQLPRGAGEAPNQSKVFQSNASKQVDKLVGADFRRLKLVPPAKTTDEQFVRRTYLGLAGRIPTYDEAIGFVSDTNPEKRAVLVDTLLDSDAYTSSFFNWWADLLRATDSFAQTSGAPYIRWIKDSINNNKPYDQMVYELLTATGGGWEEGNGSVGYYVRDKGMPLDNMANTTRIFLGTRIECAQCHNHPFDDWKQKQFYELAAFTNGLKGANDGVASQVNDQDDKQPKEVRDIARMIRYAVYDFSIADAGKGTIKLPDDYQYRDGDPGEWIGAETIFGKKVKVSTRSAERKGSESREMFADWLTSPDNPRFTHVIANRLFKRVMGTGLFEPVDNFSNASQPSNPALMTYLVELMKSLDYDMKAFQRVLYNTYTYQLSANPEQVASYDPYHFNGRQLQRLSAEQVWDSLLVMDVADVDKRKKGDYGGNIYFNGRPVLVGKKSMNQLYDEVIALKSGDEFWAYARKLSDEIKGDKGGRGGGGDSMMMGGGGSDFGGKARASELQSPMPAGHFLRQFGQSSREVIEGASTESDVTQVLSILNGEVERNLVSNDGAYIFKQLEKGKTPEEKIKILFMSILTRSPDADEMAMMLEEVKANGSKGYKNIMSALICTSEFMFAM